MKNNLLILLGLCICSYFSNSAMACGKSGCAAPSLSRVAVLGDIGTLANSDAEAGAGIHWTE